MNSMSVYEVVIVGDANVGKTAFVNRLIGGNFDNERASSILGCNVSSYKYKSVTLKFWDCENIVSHSKQDAVIIMFDITSRTTFESVAKWLSLTEHIPIRIVCGNKCDVLSSMRVVSFNDIMKLKSEHDPSIEWYEISNLSIYNLPTIINRLVTKLNDRLPVANKKVYRQRSKL